jgi:hypothetical protein
MNCPKCGTLNDDANRYCLKCGTALTVSLGVEGSQQVFQQAEAQRAFPRGGYPPQAYYEHPGGGALNIWGPFAGYGSRRRHVGWLLDGEGQRAPELNDTIDKKFRERQIPGTGLTREILVGRGVFVETRPYFILRRGLVSLALYVTHFGRDLFISLASYLKPPISNFRVIVLAVMLVFQTYMTFLYPRVLSDSFDRFAGSLSLLGQSQPQSADALFTLLCVVGPLGGLNGLALLIGFVFSTYKWLKEKDFLAALRVPPNEFNEDDLMAMEKAVEETVRDSLTEIKLNPDDLRMSTIDRGGQLF